MLNLHSSLKSHVPELCHNSENVDLVIIGMGQPQENRIFRFLKIQKLLFTQNKIFFPEVHCMKYRIR